MVTNPIFTLFNSATNNYIPMNDNSKHDGHDY